MYNSNEEEQKILSYWDEHKCFEKSVDSRPKNNPYVFYDGPPFATGTPHYGHIVASLMKDVVPRYFTMRGFRVERVWGWDCHGLPVENIVEKELGLKTKKDIESIGIEKFNETCRSKVSQYAEIWKGTIRRLGRWVDMDHAYWTMDLPYMESVWWVFKQLWDKGLVYEGYKSMHICPRCETTLSQQEVAEGYKDIKDLSVVAKFELVDEPGTFVLAWTTTPWTLPGNVALAVGEEVEYVKVKHETGKLILAKNLLEKVFKGQETEVVEEFTGQDLVGKKYKPLFPYYEKEEMPNKENLYTIVTANFVTTEDGTGVVHIAPAFGEDDMNLGKEKKLPFIQNVLMSGQYTDEVTDFAGQNVKPIDDTKKTDVEIIKYLAGKNLLFAKEQYEHSYPHCWRCDTPLINYATSSWFVNVTEIKKRALPLAEKINWSPGHIKEGRFGKWLEGARDWSISRQRFWASVMPVWRCACGETRAFGSVEELEKASGQKITDLHKHIIDKITIPCAKCKKEVKRVPDVLDTWFDSGSMPYAQSHYPFEHRDEFDQGFPAEFIAEGVDQTRAWFYYLHIIASAVKENQAFKNVIVNGTVLAEDGKKMSKRLKNYPDPSLVLEKYGADAMRYYLVSSPVMEAENLNFSETGVREMYNKLVNTLWNVVEFYQMYASSRVIPAKAGIQGRSENILDRWILSKLHLLVKQVTTEMDNYRLVQASRPIVDFVTELSQWYVRRSRDRFKGENEADKQAAINTLHEVLFTLSKVMAPFTPFIAEKIYLALGGEMESVHLENWVETNDKFIDEEIIKQMSVARQIVELGLSARAEAGIKVRQPLSQLVMNNEQLSDDLKVIVAEELNVKEVSGVAKMPKGKSWLVKEAGEVHVALNNEITPELKQEGLSRELIRTINQMRKDAKLTVKDKIELVYATDDADLADAVEKYKDKIMAGVLAEEMKAGQVEKAVEFEIDGAKVKIAFI
ncbi:MAG: isoleucine--tRNA ligase [Patescibacteria group bacterium]